MKIVLVSTYDAGGGAAIASYRLAQALLAEGHQVHILVAKKTKDDELFVSANNTYLQQKQYFAYFSWERLELLMRLKHKKDIFQFSIAKLGQHIHQHPAIQQADVVNLHWVHHNFLSIDALASLQKTNKPIVWTLHDMWAFTGGCHYTGGCEHFLDSCGQCPYLRWPSKSDLSAQAWRQKQQAFIPGRIHFTTCSKWLTGEAKKSGLLRDETVTPIPNPIDVTVFKPLDKIATKTNMGLDTSKYHILFASANTKDERKGFAYLKAALEKLLTENPALGQQIEVVVFGKMEEAIKEELTGISVRFLGSISNVETIVQAYSAVDVFAIPSLQDNLPNTIMEALACGTPVVGFATGGIPEMVIHQQTGYLSPTKNVAELATGILWAFNHANKPELSQAARNFVMENYTPAIVAAQFLKAYQSAANAISL